MKRRKAAVRMYREGRVGTDSHCRHRSLEPPGLLASPNATRCTTASWRGKPGGNDPAVVALFGTGEASPGRDAGRDVRGSRGGGVPAGGASRTRVRSVCRWRAECEGRWRRDDHLSLCEPALTSHNQPVARQCHRHQPLATTDLERQRIAVEQAQGIGNTTNDGASLWRRDASVGALSPISAQAFTRQM